jgi:hypothetical protein
LFYQPKAFALMIANSETGIRFNKQALLPQKQNFVLLVIVAEMFPE